MEGHFWDTYKNQILHRDKSTELHRVVAAIEISCQNGVRSEVKETEGSSAHQRRLLLIQAHTATSPVHKNDYSQHFVDTNQRPQNFIRDSDLADRFEEYVTSLSLRTYT